MLAFPSMLTSAAEQAGMKFPSDPDDFSPEEFPHFQVFCSVQLGRRMNDLSEHWDNAKVIAAIPDEEIKKVSLDDLIDRGLSWST